MQQASTVVFRWRARVGLALAALLLGLGAQADASLDKIIAAVEKRHQARVIRKDETTLNGRRVYVLRLRTDGGKVREIKVDVETGKEL